MKLTRVLAAKLVEGEAGKIINVHIANDCAKKDHVAGGFVNTVRKGFVRSQNGVFRIFENTTEASKYRKRPDHFLVFELLEITAQSFGNGPDKAA